MVILYSNIWNQDCQGKIFYFLCSLTRVNAYNGAHLTLRVHTVDHPITSDTVSVLSGVLSLQLADVWITERVLA